MVTPRPDHPHASAPDADEFTIRDLAAEFDVTARTLRFYEAKGLLSPRRRGQARIYSAGDRARLALILRGKRVGFTLADIREMLDLDRLGRGTSAGLRGAHARFAARIEQLQRQKADIDAALQDLEAGAAWLSARMDGREPSEDLKRRAAAFEALARTWFYGGEDVVPAD